MAAGTLLIHAQNKEEIKMKEKDKKMNKMSFETMTLKEAADMFLTYEWILGYNGDWKNVDSEYDRITVMRKNGILYAELIRGSKVRIISDVDNTGYNEEILSLRKDMKNGRQTITFI